MHITLDGSLDTKADVNINRYLGCL